jgi:hypothetical protein
MTITNTNSVLPMLEIENNRAMEIITQWGAS